MSARNIAPAAAPDLYEALVGLLSDMEAATCGGMAWIDHRDVMLFKQRAKDALAKARGEA